MTRVGLTAAFALLALLLGGCGSSSSGGAPALGEAAERTLEEQSARISWDEELGRFHGKVSFASQEADISGPGERALYTPTHVYKSHPYPDPITGKKWLRLPRLKYGTFPDDRLRALPYLASGATDVTGEIEEEVLGAAATRYEATVVVDKALDAVPEEKRELTKNALEQDLLGKRAHVTFWIDADGRLRRVGIRIPPGRKYSRTDPNGNSLTLESGPTTTTDTFDFGDFGVDVDARPPPADEVGDPTSP